MNWLLAHAGIRDLFLALVLVVASVVAPKLEPSATDLWTFLPLSLAAVLTCSGILLVVRSRATQLLALMIHLPLLLFCAAAVLLSALCLITILFAGTGLVLGIPAMILGANSASTIALVLRPQSSAEA